MNDKQTRSRNRDKLLAKSLSISALPQMYRRSEPIPDR